VGQGDGELADGSVASTWDGVESAGRGEVRRGGNDDGLNKVAAQHVPHPRRRDCGALIQTRADTLLVKVHTRVNRREGVRIAQEDFIDEGDRDLVAHLVLESADKAVGKVGGQHRSRTGRWKRAKDR
jgi:hypothetical protein